jgi:hypothetical protein
MTRYTLQKSELQIRACVSDYQTLYRI